MVPLELRPFGDLALVLVQDVTHEANSKSYAGSCALLNLFPQARQTTSRWPRQYFGRSSFPIQIDSMGTQNEVMCLKNY